MKIYLLNGFMGSGKTTLLNKILSDYSDQRIAVLINEFAPVAVDESLVNESAKMLYSIKAGTLFCSCKSNEFVDKLLELLDYGLDMILVESSGFADPNSIDKLMSFVQERSDKDFEYHNITVVDSESFLRLAELMLLVQHQVEVADLILINKTDLISAADLTRLIAEITDLNDAPFVQCQYCKVDNVLDLVRSHEVKLMTGPKKRNLSLRSCEIEIADVSSPQIVSFFELIKDKVFRAKGVLELKDGRKNCQLASGPFEITDTDVAEGNLVVLYSSLMTSEKEILDLFDEALKLEEA